jgi:sortase (surface protein transpeptidase)
MQHSSFTHISLFSLLIGIVIISPQLSFHSAAATVSLTEPDPTPLIADADIVPAATSSVPTAVVAPISTTAEPVKASVVPAPLAAEVTKQAAPAPVAPVAQPTLQQTAPVAPKPTSSVPSYYPVELTIPTIGLNAPVKPVTTNAKGEMDVPSGKTNNVGWYAPGVVPGNVGSAVMDAHVFAAFHNLHNISVGDDVYVEAADGTKLHFMVTAKRMYALSELRSDLLFQKTDGRHLNLVTCAGKLTADRSTYDHRLVVYTKLVP